MRRHLRLHSKTSIEVLNVKKVSLCVCVRLTCRMARTLLDVRLCCLDFLSRSMSSRPSSSSLASLVNTSPGEFDQTLFRHDATCSRVIVTSPLTSASPETGSSSRLSPAEHAVRGRGFLTVSPSVLRHLDSRGQMSSRAGRRLSVHWNTRDQSINQSGTNQYNLCYITGTYSNQIFYLSESTNTTV